MFKIAVDDPKYEVLLRKVAAGPLGHVYNVQKTPMSLSR